VKSPGDHCYILSLEGGGDKGSYQAGAIAGIVNATTENVQWDVISGISVGALNGAGISLFPQGNETEAAAYLLGKWRELKGYGDIYASWDSWGIIHGLLKETGLYTTSPLKAFLTNILANFTLQREFVLGATNVETGDYEAFDVSLFEKKDYVDSVMSSSAFPFIFPNVNFQNKTFMDGGVKFSLDIPSAIQKCRDKGFSDNQIVIDVVLCSSKKISTEDTKNMKSISVLLRTVEIFGYDMAMKDLNEIGHIFPNATVRYVVSPSVALPSGKIPLDFNPEQIEIMIQQGIKDAQTVVKQGPGESLKKVLMVHNVERVSAMMGRNVDGEEALSVMQKINEGKKRDHERMKAKFMGRLDI